MSKHDTRRTATATPLSDPDAPPSNAADALANPTIVGKDPALDDSPGEDKDMPSPTDPPADPGEPSADVEALRREHFARVVSPEVTEAIVGRLRLRRVPVQEREGKLSDVQTALLEMEDFPTTMERCIWAARDIADKQTVDGIRMVVGRGKHNVGATADADDYAGASDAMPVAPASFIHEEKHLVVEAALADGTVDKRAAKMMELHAQGKTHAEIGERFGCAASTVANTLSQARRDVRAAWIKRAGKLGLLAFLLTLVPLGATHRNEIAGWFERTPIRPDDSAIDHAPPPPDPRAVALREKARKACDDYDSIGCMIALDEAQKLDPAGENTPEVKAMRQRIIDGPPLPVNGDGKPHTR
jgi:hypothetical protein